MSKEEHGLSVGRVRAWLVTALLVFAGLNILLAVVRPFVAYLVVGIVLITIARWLWGRGLH